MDTYYLALFPEKRKNIERNLPPVLLKPLVSFFLPPKLPIPSIFVNSNQQNTMIATNRILLFK